MKININLPEVDTSRPVAEPGDYNCIIKVAKVEESAATREDESLSEDERKFNLRVQFTLLEDAPSHKPSGQPMKAGMGFSKWYPLQQSDNPHAPPFERDLTVLFDAAHSIEDPADRPIITEDNYLEVFTSLLGRSVIVRVTAEEDPTYGWGNSVSRVYAAA